MNRCDTTTAKTVVWTGVGIIGAVLLEAGIEWLVDKFSKYDSNGFDSNGFDREGYNRKGYNAAGYNRKGFNTRGYDSNGFDINGYNSEGYDVNGFDRSGFDAEGYDKQGFDLGGLDRAGFDKFGYDSEGYHRNGYNRAGFDREGYDWQGYGYDFYNIKGIDRYGNNRQYYAQYLEKLQGVKEKAFKQLKEGEFVYALLDTRMILEEAVNLVIGHKLGERGLKDSLLENLKVCEKNNLFGDDEDFLSRLHGVRKLCNPNMHSISNNENITYNQVHFAVMQIKELLTVTENILLH